VQPTPLCALALFVSHSLTRAPFLPADLPAVACACLATACAAPERELLAFAADALSSYPDNAFHNSWHATDVLLASHCALSGSPALSAALPRHERLALYLATLLHDSGHPGLSNGFLRATGGVEGRAPHPLLSAHGAESCLERFHSARATELLERHRGVLGGLGEAEAAECAALVQRLILATDVEANARYVSALAAQLPAGEEEAGLAARLAASPAAREALLCMVIKVADVSNVAKSWPLALRWAQLLKAEFLLLAQREAEAGLPPTAFLSAPVPQMVSGFVSFLAGPMIRALAAVMPWLAGEPLRELEANSARWAELTGAGDAPTAPDRPAIGATVLASCATARAC